MRVKADVEVLQQIPLFANSEAAHLQLLAFSSRQVELEPGGILFQKGAVGGSAYLLLTGAAEVYENQEGSGRIVATAESGALLGELAMIANVAYGVTVRAASVLSAKRIERDLFLRLVAEFPEFGAAIMRNVALRLGRSVEALKDIRPLFQAIDARS
jgi:CRP-like cAMP-binding protein